MRVSLAAWDGSRPRGTSGASLPPLSPGGARPVILVVEDDSDSAEMLKHILELEGLLVRIAGNGWDALAKAQASDIRLVILDVMLPGLDGFEVCHRLRLTPATASLPIVMVSAKARQEDRDMGHRVGADVYLTKPLSRPELVATVKKLLVKRPPGVVGETHESTGGA